jgi:hypothetical protein
MTQYTDMVEWLMMLNKNPRQKQGEENSSIKPVTIAYGYIDEIVTIIDSSNQKINQDKNELESALFAQITAFSN